jgi:acyl homoserine lactone synthase
MHVLAISQVDYAAYLDLIMEMHRLRRRVFKDRLGWEVSVSGDMEIDPYDALGPVHLVQVSEAGSVVGCVRFLPTTGPTMLTNTFPELLDGGKPPRDLRIFESSRFCVDTERADKNESGGLRFATVCLFAAMIEWGLSRDLSSIVTVTDTRVERILRRASWPLDRIGSPKEIGSTVTVAGFLEVSATALERVRENAGLKGPVLAIPPAQTIAA